MKTKFFMLLTLAAMCVACEKPQVEDPQTQEPAVQTDPRDKFVGTYDYQATGSVDFYTNGVKIMTVPINETNTFSVSKEGEEDKVVINGFYEPINATVYGNKMSLDVTSYNTSYQSIEVRMSLSQGTATLEGNTLSWTTDVNGVGTYNSVTAMGTGTLSVTAIKR